MFINKNSNILKALSIFKVRSAKNSPMKKKFFSDEVKLDCVIDESIESKYISRNFQIGVTYIQIAKSTLKNVKATLREMKEILNKCKNQPNTSFPREAFNEKFESLVKKYMKEAEKLTVNLKENLFYNISNELVFKVFDSTDLKDCILIPKLDVNKLNLNHINIRNEINEEIAEKKMNSALKYILSSEKIIKNSEEKLSKVNLTDIMSTNLVALSSNEDKESIERLIELTRRGLEKEGNIYLKGMKKKDINDLLS